MAQTHKYTIIVTGSEEWFGGDTLLQLARSSSPLRYPATDYVLAKVLTGISSAAAGGHGAGVNVEVYDNAGAGATAASGTVTFSGGGAAPNDTVTFAGVVFTAVAANPGSLQFLSGALAVNAASLAIAINGASGQLSGPATLAQQQCPRPDLPAIYGAASATVAAGVVTITSRLLGTQGNAQTLTKVGANIAVSGATLTGGTAPTAAFFV